MRFTIEVVAEVSSHLCKFGAAEVIPLRCSAHGGKSLLSSTSPRPSVVEPTRKDNLRIRGAAEARR